MAVPSTDDLPRETSSFTASDIASKESRVAAGICHPLPFLQRTDIPAATEDDRYQREGWVISSAKEEDYLIQFFDQNGVCGKDLLHHVAENQMYITGSALLWAHLLAIGQEVTRKPKSINIFNDCLRDDKKIERVLAAGGLVLDAGNHDVPPSAVNKWKSTPTEGDATPRITVRYIAGSSCKSAMVNVDFDVMKMFSTGANTFISSAAQASIKNQDMGAGSMFVCVSTPYQADRLCKRILKFYDWGFGGMPEMVLLPPAADLLPWCRVADYLPREEYRWKIFFPRDSEFTWFFGLIRETGRTTKCVRG